MRYMFIVKGDENFERSGPPPAELFEAIEKLNEEAERAGRMVFRGGLHHSAQGARLSVRDGALSIVDGPFSESKEVIGGFSIMEYPTRADAIDAARTFLEVQRVHWPKWEGVCEVRPMWGEEDGQPSE